MKLGEKLVATISDRCRACYTCVRSCPAKAIRISGGQAEVVAERCIGCGNCLQVCTQNAKRYYSSVSEVRELLAGPQPVAAIVAPSFPAEFAGIEAPALVDMIRRLGFLRVSEVGFGADLVSRRYRDLIRDNPGRRYISTSCPAIVSYIEKYHPQLVQFLAPVASPMIATARAMHDMLGDDLRIVFIGPCLAKKVEAARGGDRPDVDSVLSFQELRRMFDEDGVVARPEAADDFDPPHPGLGALYPIAGGMFQSAGISEDLLTNEVVAATGIDDFIQAVAEFEEGALDVRLLELLSCQGCIMGAGMSTRAPLYSRRSAVSRYARKRVAGVSAARHDQDVARFAKLDLSVGFAPDDTRMDPPSEEELRAILIRMGKFSPEDELDCGACGYHTCREHAVAVHKGLAESEMCLPYTIERLRESLTELNESHKQIDDIQKALINSEKLASMGQLSAGIAHEINNPLGVILLYANMLKDDVPEGSDLGTDLEMIADQAERCKKVVSGLLNFARKNKVTLKSVDLCELVDRSLRAIIVPDNVELRVEHEMDEPIAEVDDDQLIQVISNLVGNAIEAMPEGGRLTVTDRNDGDDALLLVEDTGTGIAPDHLQRIFEPLFTTKQMGKGTGLGLAVTYGIIKMHRGRIDVKSNDDPAKGPTGTVFSVRIPRFASLKNDNCGPASAGDTLG